MLPNNPNPNPPWDDPRITAYVMNELTGEDKSSFEAEMSENESLAQAVEQAREVTAKLSGFYASIPEDQLDASRREELSGQTELVSKAKPWDSVLVKFVVAASIVFVLAGLFWPSINASRKMSQVDAVAFERDSESLLIESELEEFAPVAENAPFSDFDVSDELVDVMAEPAVAAEQAVELKIGKPADSKEIAVAASNLTPRSSGLSLAKKSDADSPSPVAASMSPLSAPTQKQIDAIRSRNVQYGQARDEASAMRKMAPSSPVANRAPQFSSPVPLSSSRQSRNVPTTIRARSNSDEKFGMDMGMDMGMGPGMSGDKYDLIVENTFKRVSEHPLSTLSVDVDTASYSKVRMSLRGNRLPRPDAVRIEEMLNYFEYDYASSAQLDGPDPFVAGMAVADCPWQPDHRLVRVGLQAIELEKKERPQCNLVFLIDTSGSMRSSNKLPLVIDGMKLLLEELRPDDRVAVVVYAGSAGLVLESTNVKKKKKIIGALSKLQSGGSTNGGAGLRLAYETARENFAKDGVNRVILCSDGDFNVGMTGTDELVREAKSQAKSGIDLTVLGFGMGNHNDAMMEKISNDAEGNYGFIDTIAEAKKVLVDQLTGTLVTVAKDVKIQIKFNAALVSSYRLIGYENRVLAKEDFNDDKKDAGEIGAGHRVTALYEVVPAGKLPSAIKPAVNPLKYQPSADSDAEDEAGPDTLMETLTLHLRYKPPQGTTSTEMVQVLVDEGQSFADADADFRFAAAVAGFGMQLRNSEHAGRWTYDDVIEVARSAKGIDPHGLRAEMIELAEKARSLTVND